MKKTSLKQFALALAHLGERQLRNEARAARLIERALDEAHVPYTRRSFTVDIPRVRHASLMADGVRLAAAACSMVSGTITNNYSIISSLVSSSVLQTTPTITVNPRCRGISKSNHYFAPSFAVSPQTLSKVMAAERVKGRIEVEKVRHHTHDILVGNTTSPRALVFAHYDSIGPGVIDNASGVAVMLALLTQEAELLQEALFVFSANEELSYDMPVYWGHGFRDFEKERPELFERAEQIIVIDSVGHTRARAHTEPGLVKLAFPLTHAEQYAPKITLVAGDFDALMKVYHSDLDNGKIVSETHLRQAVSLVKSLLRQKLDKTVLK